MPIYAYRCAECGHTKDVLQKLSDPVLTTCPACGKESFAKQLTAAGFQLKGSGWYVTDFRNNNSSGSAASKPASETKSEPAKTETATATATASASASAGSSDSGSCGTSCACH